MPQTTTLEVTAVDPALRAAVLNEALTGLNKPAGEQKTLTPWLFYDEAGSHLFDRITELPEYYLTRTERNIFTELAKWLPLHLIAAVTIAELGAGSAGKTGILLREFAAHQNGLLYQPIDISPSALEEAAASIIATIPGVEVAPQVANYITERYKIMRPRSPQPEGIAHTILALYIGSSIGNFSPDEAIAILRNLRGHLDENDSLLLGVDLAPSEHKSARTLVAAYDDAAGVTAAFNKNVLTRLNRELGADFAVGCFHHRALWNPAESRIEMHLESLTDQTVHIDGHVIVFRKGETIHTENSYKFTEHRLRELLAAAGFAIDKITCDPNRLFAVALAEAE